MGNPEIDDGVKVLTALSDIKEYMVLNSNGVDHFVPLPGELSDEQKAFLAKVDLNEEELYRFIHAWDAACEAKEMDALQWHARSAAVPQPVEVISTGSTIPVQLNLPVSMVFVMLLVFLLVLVYCIAAVVRRCKLAAPRKGKRAVSL